MENVLALAGSCRIAQTHNAVWNTECAYTFHSPYTTPAGIVVNLSSFLGTVQDLALQDQDKGLFVRIVKERVLKPTNEETKAAPTKLGVGVEGGFDSEETKYETRSKHSVVVLEKKHGRVEDVLELPYTDETKRTFPDMVTASVDSILNHVGMSLQQDVKVWQLDQDEDIQVSKYAADLPFVDNGIKIDPNPATWKCAKSGATDNLWLNLSDGYIGGGRQNWNGSGGSNGALEHFEETGRQYPLVVKLGTITADIATADCYSYAPNEDGPVKIPNLKELLEKRGIHVASLQKTEKSTAELEVELNANYAFDAITEAGAHLQPLSGPGLQGLQNLGNSCYLNSVVQLLLSGTVPELAHRYGVVNRKSSITEHPLLIRVMPRDAPKDLLCQTTKVGCALTSGVFAKPQAVLQAEQEQQGDNSTSPSSNDPKYRLAPRMLKHVVGKDHVDFCTGQQQDAAQFLQYFLELLDRAEQGAKADVQPSEGPLYPTSHLFSFQTQSRMVCSSDQRIKYKDSASETVWSLRVPMDKATVKEADSGDTKEATPGTPDPKRLKAGDDSKEGEEKEETKEPVPTISFSTCVDEWAADTRVDDIRWSHLQNAVHAATEHTRFVNFPRYLIVQIQRYQLGPDWTPIKLEVNLDIPQEIDLNAYRATGPQEGENLVPDEGEETPAPAASAVPAVVNEVALTQLMDMGFSLNGSKRALMAVGGNDVEAATGWVFEHSMDPDFNDPPSEPLVSGVAAASPSASGVDEGVVQSLVENLGCFSADQVRAALKETNGAADRAADWLFSHMDDLDGAIAALQSNEQSSSSTNTPKVPMEDGDGKYTMVGLISHIGKNTGSGHYVAHLKKDGKWVIFNDEKVALSAQPPFQHAYMYLFQRNDTIGSPSSNY